MIQDSPTQGSQFFFKSFALAALVALLPTIPCRADIIILRDGSRLEGEIIGEEDGKLKVRVRRAAVVEVPAKDVKKIERKLTKWQELDQRRKKLGGKDTAGRMALAKWCKKNFLTKQARALYEEVIKIDPNHVVARAALGYVKHEGQWILEADFYKAQGFVKHKGQWISKDEADRLKAQSQLKKRIKALIRLYRRGDRRALEAEKELLSLKPGEVVGPLLLPYLEERRESVRKLVIRALGESKYDGAAIPLLEIVHKAKRRLLAELAGKALWHLGDSGKVKDARTRLVQSLFNKSEGTRLRAANVLQAINDPQTIPYLIEALYLKRYKRVNKVEENHGVTRSGQRSRGAYGQYNLPLASGAGVQRSRQVLESVYVFNPSARRALSEMTGRDYDYDKAEWFAWWKKNGKAFLAKHGKNSGKKADPDKSGDADKKTPGKDEAGKKDADKKDADKKVG